MNETERSGVEGVAREELVMHAVFSDITYIGSLGGDSVWILMPTKSAVFHVFAGRFSALNSVVCGLSCLLCFFSAMLPDSNESSVSLIGVVFINLCKYFQGHGRIFPTILRGPDFRRGSRSLSGSDI